MTKKLLQHGVPIDLVQNIMNIAFQSQIDRYKNMFYKYGRGDFVREYLGDCESCGVLVIGSDNTCMYCCSLICENCVLPKYKRKSHVLECHIPNDSYGCLLCEKSESLCTFCRDNGDYGKMLHDCSEFMCYRIVTKTKDKKLIQ